MKFSTFGQKFTDKSGILQLMDDLGKALSGQQKMYMLGGGNPAHIPEVQAIYRKQMERILSNGDEFERMVGNYTTQQGDGAFIEAITKLFKNTYGWNVTSKNIAIMPGSQVGFFFLFNMLAGEYADGTKKKILLPLVPEYIGYADQGLTQDFFTAAKPELTYLDEHTFKYRIDFNNLKITEDIAAICVSRPTNPTGNVVTDEEINQLRSLAKQHDIPLIIDNAYGAPFPNILFTEAEPVWDEGIIYSLSLSKIGLPSTRTSIIIASEEIVAALSSINAIVSLSTGTTGEFLTRQLMESGEILKISNELIKPYYQKKSQEAITYFHEQTEKNIPYYLHKSEGALFLWLWVKDMPISSIELYNRLKSRNILVVPGEYFFPGLQESWQHKYECIRITYSQKTEDIQQGLFGIADELKKLY